MSGSIVYRSKTMTPIINSFSVVLLTKKKTLWSQNWGLEGMPRPPPNPQMITNVVHLHTKVRVF